MGKRIKLIALDLDGTLLDENKHLSEKNRNTIKEAVGNGVHVIVSTGRPFSGLPIEDMREMGMEYAISTNGAAIYQVSEDKVETIYKDGMKSELAYQVMESLSDLNIHMDAVMDGQGYSDEKLRCKIRDLSIKESMKEYIHASRVFVPDLKAYLKQADSLVQKMTIYFYSCEDKEYIDYEETYNRLKSRTDVGLVSGGYHNIEVTQKGVTKGKALCFLADKLGIDISETMACGDTQNDIDILVTAGIGVAMGNATEDVKEIADYISLSNEEDGVAYAIEHFLKGEKS